MFDIYIINWFSCGVYVDTMTCAFLNVEEAEIYINKLIADNPNEDDDFYIEKVNIENL